MADLNNIDIESLVKEVLKSVLNNKDAGNRQESDRSFNPPAGGLSGIGVADYPLGKKMPGLIKTPTGKSLDDITLSSVMEGKIGSDDVRITAETLNLQAQIAEQVSRPQFARNLRRAAELTAIPDQRVLEIYNALRPYRSTKDELLAIADELEDKYQAKINAAMVRQAAEVYEKRNRLRK